MMRMSAAIGAVVLCSLAAPAAQPDALVTFDVVVEDSDGSFVDGLRRQDFIVTIDDRDVVVEACALDTAAASVVVMFDITSSSPWPGLKPDHQSINDLLLAQFRATDRVRIASFGRRITMSPEFTTDRTVARRFLKEVLALPEVERSGPSPIWDAVDAALTTLEPEQGRRALILITDGKATGNYKDRSDVERRSAVLGIPVSTIAVGPGAYPVKQTGDETAVVRPGLALEHLAATTGGLAVVMPDGNALPSPMTTVALALRQTYKLSVTTELAPDRSYSVRIRSGDSSHRVRTRAWVRTVARPAA